jgi:hypothetical protein
LLQKADAKTSQPELSLDYAAFDQDLGHGWRKLSDAKKFQEAAALIDAYLKHRDDLAAWQRRNLQFHKGQLLAIVGENATALIAFRAAIDSEEAKTSPLSWNAYVKATIAFLEKNREELKKMRDNLAVGAKWHDDVNLKVIDRLIANFDKSYAEAYGGK